MNDRMDGDQTAPGGTPRILRRKTRAEERIEALDTSGAGLDEQLREVRERLAAAEQEAAENKAGWQRTAADFANFKRRTEQDREATLALANEILLRKLLAVVDDFDRAMASMPRELEHLGWIEGLWAIDRKLRLLLESEGLTPIEAVGRPFDPREHEAVVHEETTSAPDGHVMTELQRGYRIRERVLRPAMVAVANNTGGGASPGPPDSPATAPDTTSADEAGAAPRSGGDT